MENSPSGNYYPQNPIGRFILKCLEAYGRSYNPTANQHAFDRIFEGGKPVLIENTINREIIVLNDDIKIAEIIDNWSKETR